MLKNNYNQEKVSHVSVVVKKNNLILYFSVTLHSFSCLTFTFFIIFLVRTSVRFYSFYVEESNETNFVSYTIVKNGFKIEKKNILKGKIDPNIKVIKPK